MVRLLYLILCERSPQSKNGLDRTKNVLFWQEGEDIASFEEKVVHGLRSESSGFELDILFEQQYAEKDEQ